MFALVSKSIIGSIVLFLRIGSHAVSFADKDPPSRMVGRVAGQSTSDGAYPPDGELGNARPATSMAAAIGTAARSSNVVYSGFGITTRAAGCQRGSSTVMENHWNFLYLCKYSGTRERPKEPRESSYCLKTERQE